MVPRSDNRGRAHGRGLQPAGAAGGAGCCRPACRMPYDRGVKTEISGYPDTPVVETPVSGGGGKGTTAKKWHFRKKEDFSKIGISGKRAFSPPSRKTEKTAFSEKREKADISGKRQKGKKGKKVVFCKNGEKRENGEKADISEKRRFRKNGILAKRAERRKSAFWRKWDISGKGVKWPKWPFSGKRGIFGK